MYCCKTTDFLFTLLIAGIILSSFSCEEKKAVTSLYNIDSLVMAQAQVLAGHQAKLQKVASIGGKQDDSVFIPRDTAVWNAELEIFRQLDIINKPINRAQYSVQDGLFDRSSNLTVREISTADDLPVRYFKIYYQSSLHKPRKIEAFYDDRNALYKSGRLLRMEFEQIHNKTILTSYAVEGGQKMMMGDSVAFIIKGKIIID